MELLNRPSRPHVGRSVRVACAAWTTVVLHVTIAAVLTMWVRGEAEQGTASRPAEPLRADLVWLERPDTPTGGGKNGNNDRRPAPSAQRPGKSRITVPVRVPPSFTGAEDRKPPPQEISIPAVPDAAGLREVPGVVSLLALADHTTPGGPDSGGGSGDGKGPGLDKGLGGHSGGGSPGTGSDVRPPQLVVQIRPEYTSAALMARVQGVVGMEAVVMADGTVGEVRIRQSLDRSFGLDQQAIKAVKLWRFRPATRLGQAVPAWVSIEMTFSLR